MGFKGLLSYGISTSTEEQLTQLLFNASICIDAVNIPSPDWTRFQITVWTKRNHKPSMTSSSFFQFNWKNLCCLQDGGLVLWSPWKAELGGISCVVWCSWCRLCSCPLMGEGTDGLRFHALMKDEPFIFSNLFYYLVVRGDSDKTSIASWRGYGTELWVLSFVRFAVTFFF